MAAITPSVDGLPKKGGRAQRTYGAGAANEASTLTTAAVGHSQTHYLRYAQCGYSGAVTQAGVTVTLRSGLGAAYDLLLHTGSTNAQVTAYVPDNPIPLLEGDSVEVAAPAGGSGDVANIVIVTEMG